LIGPVLAIQYGYMPGLVWIVVGVCLAGAVQDMLQRGDLSRDASYWSEGMAGWQRVEELASQPI